MGRKGIRQCPRTQVILHTEVLSLWSHKIHMYRLERLLSPWSGPKSGFLIPIWNAGARKAGTVTTEAKVGRRWSQSRNFGSCIRQTLFLLREGNMTYTWTCTWSEIISLDIIWVPRLENAFILSHWEFVTTDAGDLCALRDGLPVSC